MTQIYQWVENIAFYSVLLVLVMHVLPAGEQKKYVQFFMGLVFMLLIFSPVLEWMGQEENVEALFRRAVYDQEVAEFLQEQKRLERDLENFTLEMLREVSEAESEGAEDGEPKRQGGAPDRESKEPGEGSGKFRDDGTRMADGGGSRTGNEAETGAADGGGSRTGNEAETGAESGRSGWLVEPVEIRIGEDKGDPP